MTAKLKLIVSNMDVNERIIASIRPLDREVAPSEPFRRKTKLRLLESLPGPDGAEAA